MTLTEGFDFNSALQNDISDTIDNTYNQQINNNINYTIEDLIKKYKIIQKFNINIGTNNISINYYCGKGNKGHISITNVKNKLILDFKQELDEDDSIELSIIDKVSFLKNLIKYTKIYYISDKIEVCLYINYRQYKQEFNNLYTISFNIDNLYFIHEFIKDGIDVVYKDLNKPKNKLFPFLNNSKNKFSTLKNKNIHIYYIDNARDIKLEHDELKNVLQYINEHYMSSKTFMFITYGYNYHDNIKDFNNYFFSHIDLNCKFNDNYISYDENEVKITETDVLLVCKHIITANSVTKKESGLKKIISNVSSIPKLYSRLVLGMLCLNIFQNYDVLIDIMINANKYHDIKLDIFKAYYNKIIDNIIQHGFIYQTMINYSNE